MSVPVPSPHSLLLVRSTLEMAALIKSLHPNLNGEVEKLEIEVVQSGQLILDAGCEARARLALQRLHAVRLSLQELTFKEQEWSSRLAASERGQAVER